MDAVRHAAAAYQALSQGAASKRHTHSFDMGALPSVPELNVQQIPTRASNEVHLATSTRCLPVAVIPGARLQCLDQLSIISQSIIPGERPGTFSTILTCLLHFCQCKNIALHSDKGSAPLLLSHRPVYAIS